MTIESNRKKNRTRIGISLGKCTVNADHQLPMLLTASATKPSDLLEKPNAVEIVQLQRQGVATRGHPPLAFNMYNSA